MLEQPVVLDLVCLQLYAKRVFSKKYYKKEKILEDKFKSTIYDGNMLKTLYILLCKKILS